MPLDSTIPFREAADWLGAVAEKRTGPIWHPSSREVATLLSEGLCPIHCKLLGTERRKEGRVIWTCRCFCYDCGLCWEASSTPDDYVWIQVLTHHGQGSGRWLRLDD